MLSIGCEGSNSGKMLLNKNWLCSSAMTIIIHYYDLTTYLDEYEEHEELE